MFKKAVQRGRSERRNEAYVFRYVEHLRDASTKLADFFNILLRLFLRMLDLGDMRSASRRQLARVGRKARRRLFHIPVKRGWKKGRAV